MKGTFANATSKSCELIQLLLDHKEEIKDVLMKYQPIAVTDYEIDRCLYTLKHIDKLEEYLNTCSDIHVAVFLPSNLPLYSIVLFAIMPSFTSRSVILRPNFALIEDETIDILFDILRLKYICPNIELFTGNRNEFIPHIEQSDLIVFTGRNSTKDIIRKHMRQKSWMINNGSGHNPIVVAEGADVDKAVENVAYAKFFNAGQDCAGPDAVFVHEKVADEFLVKIKDKVSSLKVGDHSDPNTIVGNIFRMEELERLQSTINNNMAGVIAGGQVNVNRRIVYPTIILSDIQSGTLNHREIFGPILLLYTYQKDDQLRLYFEDAKYMQNKMYVSLFGKSEYINDRNDDECFGKNNSVKRGVGRILHDKIIHDLEVDNGTVAYGGYSKNASSVIYKDQNGYFNTVAIPVLIPEVIHNVFIQNIHIKDLTSAKSKKLHQSAECAETKMLQSLKRDLSTNFINLVNKEFDSVIFAFIFGSIANGTFQQHKNDIDTFICVRNKGEQGEYFMCKIKSLYEKFHLRFDCQYPSEIVDYTVLSTELYNFYYQLYGTNYNYRLDSRKYNCDFLGQFQCHDTRTYDLLFWASVIAEDNKLALINRDKKLFQQLLDDCKELMSNIKEEILLNITDNETTDLPDIFKEKYPGCNNKQIADKLKNINYYEMVRCLRCARLDADNQSN